MSESAIGFPFQQAFEHFLILPRSIELPPGVLCREQLGGGPLQHDAAGLHHVGAARHGERRLDVLLHQHDGGAEAPVDLRRRLQHALHEHGREPDGGLVHHQEPRPLHERDAEIEIQRGD